MREDGKGPGRGGGPLWEVLRLFLGLGWTSFGGPSAHVGYFREACVVRRGWLDEGAFAGWVALCQFLPGPASTQLAFCLGWSRGGWLGGWLAFLGFMLPSGLIMAALGWWLPRWAGPGGDGVLHGLKVAAWAVVGHAVVGMGRRLAGARLEMGVAVVAGGVAWAWSGGWWMQPLMVLGGAIAGMLASGRGAMEGVQGARVWMRPWHSLACLVLGAGLLVAALPWWTDGRAGMVAALYRAGALVFGGGHVVLPFLEEAVVRDGGLSRDDFLAGYGAAQALPGPMFTLAAYLGMRMGGWVGAGLGLGAIFLPGLLLVSAAAPSWAWLAGRGWAARAVSGAGGVVVGLLAAAWMGPVWSGAIRGWADVAMGGAAWAVLASGRVPPAWVVAACAATGWMAWPG